MTGPRVTLRNLLGLLTSRWKLLLCATLLGGVIGAVYSLTRKPVFESDALLAPVRAGGELDLGGGALGGLVGEFAGMAGLSGLASVGSSLNESVAVLDSRQFALQFMRGNGVLQYLFPKLWDAKEQRWIDSGSGQAPGIVARLKGLLEPVPDWVFASRQPGPSADDAVKRFDLIRVAQVDRRTNFIQLKVRGPTPEVAQRWATTMITQLNESMRNRTLDEARKAVDLLTQYISTEHEESIRAAAIALLEAQLRREVVAESRQEFAVQVLDPPSLPVERYYPRRAHMALLSAILGFLVGAAGIVCGSAVRTRKRKAVFAAQR